MNEHVKNDRSATPMLFPFDPELFWERMQDLIRSEIQKQENGKEKNQVTQYETPGLTYKPLYKINEVCALLRVSRPTIYDWIKYGKLKPYKIRSRLYFLWNDIQQLIEPDTQK